MCVIFYMDRSVINKLWAIRLAMGIRLLMIMTNNTRSPLQIEYCKFVVSGDRSFSPKDNYGVGVLIAYIYNFPFRVNLPL